MGECQETKLYHEETKHDHEGMTHLPQFGINSTGKGEGWENSCFSNLLEEQKMDWWRTLDTERIRWEAIATELLEVKVIKAKTNLEDCQ